MKKPDKERLKKIVAIWDELQKQMALRGITADTLLADEFSQWAVTTPLYNIGEQNAPAAFLRAGIDRAPVNLV